MSESPTPYPPRPVTSASNIHRRKACPGSERMEKDLPDTPSDDATEGTMLHKVMAEGVIPPTLTDDQRGCVEYCREQDIALIQLGFKDRNTEIGREVFMEIPDLISGTADFVAVMGGVAVVADYKFGRDPVTKAEENLQLRSYALLVAEKYLCHTVYAAIIQPRVAKEYRGAPVKYTLYDLEIARQELAHIRADCRRPDAELIPGNSQCRYCRARATCPAVEQEAQELTVVSPAAICAGNAASLYRRAKLVEKHLDAIKSAVYLLVERAEQNNEKIPGLTLKPGAAKRSITDAQKAFSALSDKIGSAQFIPCCTVKISALDAAFKEATGLKAKDAKAEMERLLNEAGCLETKVNKPSLVEVEA